MSVLSNWNNKCIDVPNGDFTDGRRLIVWTCTGGTNQQWTLRADGSIAGVQSGRCVTPTAGATGVAVGAGAASHWSWISWLSWSCVRSLSRSVT